MNPHTWLNRDQDVLQQLITLMKGTVRISKFPHPPDQLNGQDEDVHIEHVPQGVAMHQ